MSDTKPNTPVCNIFLFKFFFTTFFRDAEATNEELIEILDEFSKYMRANLPEEKILEFVPKSHMEVIALENHPFYTKGFNPGFVLHFTEFVKQQEQTNG